MKFKKYQVWALDALADFFKETAASGDVALAFANITERKQEQRLTYIPVAVPGLTGVPYVCLRVPTGGGKTVMACQAAGHAQQYLLQRDGGVILWLVPTTSILDQTLKALRNPNHFYRKILEDACGNVTIHSIAEALSLPAGSGIGSTAVIVSTIQSFRVDDSEGRKVFTKNDSLLTHFAGASIPAGIEATLEKNAETGNIVPSLANLIRMHRPIVIVDEAHNARTELSFATLGKLRPSCIVEFTATPDMSNTPSNVLYRVTAGHLKVDNMVKLPLHILRRDPSQEDSLLADSIQMRADLEAFAITESQKTGEYIRPILLLQASQIADCDDLKEKLVREYPTIQADQVAISHGQKDDLAAVDDLEDPTCPIRFIITVQKLTEGWDCPFAYVLCSLRNMKSKVALEQIVGRVLRLPKTTPKETPQLNRAYAYSLSANLREAMAEFVQALEANGFTKAEIEQLAIPVPPRQGGLFDQPRTVQLAPDTEVDHDKVNNIRNSPTLTKKLDISNDGSTITIFVAPTSAEEPAILALATTPEGKERLANAIEAVRAIEATFGPAPLERSPYMTGTQFRVPLLCVSEDSQATMEFEKTFLLERAMGIGASTDASLGTYDPDKRPKAVMGTVDVSKDGGVSENAATEQDQEFVRVLHDETFRFTSMSAAWTREELIRWLASNIPHQDVLPDDFGAYLARVLNGVTAGHDDTRRVKALVADRFRLARTIQNRINELRAVAQRTAFNEFLFDPVELSKLTAGSDSGHVAAFDTVPYSPNFPYAGTYAFKKHYYGAKPGDLLSKGEEHDCAVWLDEHPQVEFWVRNLAQKPTSFRLLTPEDWYYPDFVAKLTDGRFLVLEYKGKHLYTAQDAIDKRAVGAVWESKMAGRGRHVMTNGPDYEASVGNPIP